MTRSLADKQAEDWLLGARWTWRVGLRALSPFKVASHYRAMRRQRGFWPTTFRVSRWRCARFVLWCSWREFSGFARKPSEPNQHEGLLDRTDVR